MQFTFLRRFLDDLLAVSAPRLPQLLYGSQRRGWLHGLYPGDGSGLAVVLQQHPDPLRLPYMDLLLAQRCTEAGGLWVDISLYDKLMDAKFAGLHISRYVPSHTNVDPMHTNHIYGSQLARFFILCGSLEDFIRQAGVCMGRLLFVGYKLRRLKQLYTRTCRGHTHAYCPGGPVAGLPSVVDVARRELSRLQQLQREGAGTVGCPL